MTPANPDDAHRPLEKHHDLAAILSHVEKRQVNNDYTFSLEAKIYRIVRQDICTGLRGGYHPGRADGGTVLSPPDSVTAIFASNECEQRPKVTSAKPPAKTKALNKPVKGSEWNKELRSEEGAESLAGRPSVPAPAEGISMTSTNSATEVARSQKAPGTGKLSKRPDSTWAGL